MFILNDDLSIYATRGDTVFFTVSAEDDGVAYKFQPGDVVRIKIFGKKDAENVVLQKDFPVFTETENVEILLTKEDTKIGEVISKPKDYWYEVELNPLTKPQTLIGYDEDGAKIFKLFPEGDDLEEFVPNKEDIPVMDAELDTTSPRPVQNQAIARAVINLKAAFGENVLELAKTRTEFENTKRAVSAVDKRVDRLVASKDSPNSRAVLEYAPSVGEDLKTKVDAVIESDGLFATVKVNWREANLLYGGTTYGAMFVIPSYYRPASYVVSHIQEGITYWVDYSQSDNCYAIRMQVNPNEEIAPFSAHTAEITYALGNYELNDLRVGADGVTYASAGTAIREQIKPIASQVKAKNLIDYKKLTRGYMSESGTLSSTVSGTYHEVTSDFIAVEPASSYYFAHRFSPISEAIKAGQWQENWFACNLYDANKCFIKRVSYNTPGCVIPGEVFDGASYVRVSYRTYMFNRPIFAMCSVPCDAVNDPCEVDNLLDTYPMIFNGYVAYNNGMIIGATIDGDKFVPTAENELTSDFIPCASGDEMFIFATASQDNFIRIAFYDASGVFVSSFAYSPTAVDNKGVTDYDNILDTFAVPDGAIALRISCRGAYIKECVIAHNDQQRKHLYAECERKYSSKHETEKIKSSFATGSLINSVAHRGYSTDAPENTLAAYRLAKKKGFVCAECDVSFTSDGYAVLLHDASVDRTSNGTGNIASMTLADVRSLDFGSWKSAEYAGEKIPTFEEFIVLCKRLGLHPYIELKAGTKEQIQALVNVVKRYGMKGKVTWISFYTECLEYIKSVDTKARLGYVTYYIDADIIKTAKQLLSEHNEVFISCSYNGAYSAAVQLCADAEIPFEVWTVNSESAILGLDAYVSGVTSDNIIAGNVIYEACIND